MKKLKHEEAKKILNIFRFYQKNGKLYLDDDIESLDSLFDATVDAINSCGAFKIELPYIEFVHPCKEIAAGDDGWIGHFDERDNRRFFLSDLYDFLKLFYS